MEDIISLAKKHGHKVLHNYTDQWFRLYTTPSVSVQEKDAHLKIIYFVHPSGYYKKLKPDGKSTRVLGIAQQVAGDATNLMRGAYVLITEDSYGISYSFMTSTQYNDILEQIMKIRRWLRYRRHKFTLIIRHLCSQQILNICNVLKPTRNNIARLEEMHLLEMWTFVNKYYDMEKLLKGTSKM